jgi:hypothetical protein
MGYACHVFSLYIFSKVEWGFHIVLYSLCPSALTCSLAFILFPLQYIPSVEDTVLGVVVDTKPDVSTFMYIYVN